MSYGITLREALTIGFIHLPVDRAPPVGSRQVRRIDPVFAIGRKINGQWAVDRLVRRQVDILPLVADFERAGCAASAMPRSPRRSTTCFAARQRLPRG